LDTDGIDLHRGCLAFPATFDILPRLYQKEQMSQSQAILDRAQQVLIPNYARVPVVMVRGEGCRVWDADGREYLDMFAGFGGGILGHCHPALVRAATDQANKLWHVGNTFHSEPQVEFAERLNKTAFRGQAFFCHSGAEANEAACKLARLRGHDKSPKRWKIISFNKSFHGRTLAMIAATGNPKVKDGFEPAVPGFINVEPNFDAVMAALDDETAGILMEPIQGEGGVNLWPDDLPRKLRNLCDERGLTLIFDEVWTGCGRTGKWFAHQHFTGNDGRSIVPDIMTMGKAIGGGLPVGAMFAKPEVAALFVPGKHGCTLGGNPICMSVSRTIFDIIEKENLIAHSVKMGELAMAKLRGASKIASRITQVRGKGLFLGVELSAPPEKLLDKALAKGIIVNLTAQKVIRLAPPINIGADEWERGLDVVIDLIAGL
jgi:predicted acetylornithine/succinylornithine family transaminase